MEPATEIEQEQARGGNVIVNPLPDTFDARFKQLKELTGKAVNRLFEEVKKRDTLAKAHGHAPFLTEPYGRLPRPSPLITRAQFMAMKEQGLIDMSVNIDDLSDPNFEFQYGFNPLRFIADYLKWWHPSSAEQRLRDRELAAMTLLNKAMAAKIEHGLTREQELMQMYTESGIVYGPMTTPISESSVLAVATGVIQSGHIAFELSSSADFSNIIQRLDVGVGRLNQAKALFENLEPSKKYFIRCSLFSAGELERQRNVAIKLQAAAEAEALSKKKGFQRRRNASTEEAEPIPTTTELEPTELATFRGPEKGAFSQSTFWTIPSASVVPGESSEKHWAPTNDVLILDGPLTLITECLTPKHPSLITRPADVKTYAGSTTAIPSEGVVLSCILGDVFPSVVDGNFESEPLQFFTSGSSSFINPQSFLKTASTVFAWNDTSLGAHMSLMAEELAYKQYLSAMKKYKKKYESDADKKGTLKGGKTAKEKTVELNGGPPPPPPTLLRPEPTNTFLTLADAFPICVQENVSRNFHRVIDLGRYIQLFVLDMREGDLGKAQTKWIKDAVEGSAHPWKIILSGVPLGLEEKASITRILTQKSTDNSTAPLETESNSHEETAPSTAPSSDDKASSSNIQSIFRKWAQNFLYQEEEHNSLGEVESVDGDGGVTDNVQDSLPVTDSVSDPQISRSQMISPEDGDLSVSSGIIFVTAGVPTPYFVTYNPPQEMITPSPNAMSYVESNSRSCFAVELGVGNAHWPANFENTKEKFDVVSNLGSQFLYGFDSTSSNTTSFSSSSSITISPHGKMSVKIFNTSASIMTPVKTSTDSAVDDVTVSAADKGSDPIESPVLVFQCNLKATSS